MKFKLCLVAAFLFLKLAAGAQTTAFTYQGQLNSSNAPATGVFDFRFQIYNANNSVVTGPLTNAPVGVTNGLFTVILDFGADVFDGSARSLEIGVRSYGDTNAYVVLSPRQPLTSVPYAIQALNASNAMALTAPLEGTNLIGTIPNSLLSPNVAILTNNVVFSGSVTATNFTGNGAGLTGVNAATAGTAANAQNLVDNQGNVLVQPEYSYTTNLIPSLNTNQLWVTNTAVTGADGWTYWNSIMGCYTNSAWVIGYVASDGLYVMGVPPFSDLNFGNTYYDDNQPHMTNCSTIQNLIWVPDTGSSSTVLTYFPTNSTTNIVQQTLGISIAGTLTVSNLVASNVSGGAVGLTNFGLGVFTETNLDNTAWMYAIADRLNDNLYNVGRYRWTNLIAKLKAGKTVRIEADVVGDPPYLVDGLGLYSPLPTIIPYAGWYGGWPYLFGFAGFAYSGPVIQNADRGMFPASFFMTTNTGGVIPARTLSKAWNVIEVDYLAWPQGSSFTVSTNNNNSGAYGAISGTINTIGAGTNVASFFWTNTAGPQLLGFQFASTSAGTNAIISFGLWDSTVTNGFVTGSLTSNGGDSLIYTVKGPASNIVSQLFQQWQPDIILLQDLDYATVMSTNLPLFLSLVKNSATNAQVVFCVTYPDGSGVTEGLAEAQMMKNVAQNYGASCFDGYSPFGSTNIMAARGLFSGDWTHMPNAYPFYGYWLYRWLDFQDFYYQ